MCRVFLDFEESFWTSGEKRSAKLAELRPLCPEETFEEHFLGKNFVHYPQGKKTVGQGYSKLKSTCPEERLEYIFFAEKNCFQLILDFDRKSSEYL